MHCCRTIPQRPALRVGKAVGALVGASLQLAVTGPGLEFEQTVSVGADGRAAVVDGMVHDRPCA